jgi:hypothetical protein
MAPAPHVPSLTHLREFARARAAGRATHVAQDRAQVNAPADDRFFGFAYEKFLTSTITYVQQGRRSTALDRAPETAPARMAASYQAAAKGMSAILEDLDVVQARRKQHNVVVVDPDSGESLVSLRLHLLLECGRGDQIACHMYFPQQALTPLEQHVMHTAVALAADQLEQPRMPGVALVRSGRLILIDDEARADARIELLRNTSADYRTAWDNED